MEIKEFKSLIDLLFLLTSIEIIMYSQSALQLIMILKGSAIQA